MAKVLVVDDNSDVAHLLSEILQREGHEVEVSYDGSQVVDRLEAGEVFDIILTDLIMPELDGIGLVKYIKEKRNDTPIIALSGGGVTIDSEDALKAVGSMVSGVLKKPIQYDELLKIIGETLA